MSLRPILIAVPFLLYVGTAIADPRGDESWKLPGRLESISGLDRCESLEHLRAIAERCDGTAEALSSDVLSITCFYGSGAGTGDVSIFVHAAIHPLTQLERELKALEEPIEPESSVDGFIRVLTSPELVLPDVAFEDGHVRIRGQATFSGYKTEIALEVDNR